MKWIVAGLSLMLLSGCCCMPERSATVERTAWVAKVPAENIEAARSLCAEVELDADRGGIYLREIEGETYLFQYLENVDAVSSPRFQCLDLRYSESAFCTQKEAKWQKLVEPLPVAKRNGRVFEPMERIFYEEGVADKKPDGAVVRIAMFTELKPEKEKDYRLLHDNPWPDVIAAIHKANFRHFSVFLEEIDGKLYLFGWLEYVGSDIAADDASNKKDPASTRWWKETDACQIAPPDANGGMWGGLEELRFTGE
jgi:L-rhamnose mutarotase